MRLPREYYQMTRTIAAHLPHLRRAHCRGLALWVYGTLLAQSACQNAVITALLTRGAWHALRQRLREWLYDGADKADPCRTQVEVTACFAPLLGWVLTWWQGDTLAVALDATAHGDLVVALVLSVLYRGNAIPVAWAILPANQPGAWMPAILALVQRLQPAVPPPLTVLLLADRGLWSPRLWHQLLQVGWHPVVRLQNTTSFQPQGQGRRPVRTLVTGPGQAWVGRGIAFKAGAKRQAGTVLVVWDAAHPTPWVLLTDLLPAQIGVCWYGLRVWIELGFRALKGVGWQWQHTRRSDPTRVARHWLVLAVAMLWVLAYGTRAEDAEQQGVPPARLVRPPAPPTGRRRRRVSVFRRGLQALRQTLGRGYLWRRLWLVPEPWPEPPPNLLITYHTGP
jgi:Transposase DDE domain